MERLALGRAGGAELTGAARGNSSAFQDSPGLLQPPCALMFATTQSVTRFCHDGTWCDGHFLTRIAEIPGALSLHPLSK